MKKSLNLLCLILCSALVVSIGSGRIFARVAGGGSSAEAWCTGAATVEVCVDAGNLFPTTNNSQTLGTSSLAWATVYAYDMALSDDLTVADDLTVGGDLFHTPISTQTVGAGGTIDLTGACNGFVRLTSTQSRTTDTTNTFTAPTAANIGCVYYITNVGPGGTITLDDNALFDVPANVVLGTNDGAIIVQGATSYILLGTSDN